MKSLMLLLQELLEELSSRCCTSATRDLKTIESRIEQEGESFLTIALPEFAKDLERALELGSVEKSMFRGFSRRKGIDPKDQARTTLMLPEFLYGFMSLIFDPISGDLFNEADLWKSSHEADDNRGRHKDAILAVRQICLMFGKIDKPCSDARVSRALRQYVETDQEVAKFDSEWSEDDFLDFSRMSNLLYAEILSKADLAVYQGGILPQHGPGATADRLTGNGKYDQQTWPERLDRCFPFLEYALPSPSYYHKLDHVNFLESGAEIPVRVITVPKTAKTPRIIAIEPTAMQFMQQGIREQLYDLIEGDELLSQMIGFTDQTPNQLMARKGSSDGSLATLDLSEASDRVSVRHVQALLLRARNLSDAVFAVRSSKADVDGYGVLTISKYASMGSALTFPLEAMVFLVTIFLGIERDLGHRLTHRTIRNYVGKVRVYGDDIIVPVEHVRSVIGELESKGFKVNANKSFWTGKFRESCGKEYYDGTDVSIVRVRRVFPTSRKDAKEIVSLVSLRNQFYWSGMWRTAHWLDGQVRRFLDHYPVVLPSAPVLGRHSCLGYETTRMHPTLHKPLVRGYVVRSSLPTSSVSGEGALLKWFLKRGSEPFADRKHLERSGRPDAVGIKLRWASPV